MPGNKVGALKAAATMKKKYGDRYFAAIGYVGGKNGTTGGFFADRELAVRAGIIGGKRSHRPPLRWSEENNRLYPEYADMFALRQTNKKKWTYHNLAMKFNMSRQMAYDILNPKKRNMASDAGAKHEQNI